MLTLSKAIAAASLFVGKQEVRPQLHYIAFMPRDGFLLVSATNGHTAFFGKTPLPDDFGTVTMLAHKDFTKLVKPSSTCSIQEGKLSVNGSAFPLEMDGSNYTFPDVMRIIPRNLSNKTESGAYQYLIAPGIGEKISKAEKIIEGKSDGLPTFQVNGSSPWLASISEDAFVVAMPYRTNLMPAPDEGLYKDITGNTLNKNDSPL